mmetsp:Transcript_29940/g.43800  ORF Transcript_29940/g.43800 Transcript_29940/m.43800 type:complete len:192 (+) Transcript_29940:241-816(+)|eukprot:CAMPEP_0179455522 /NCGR_PEP_ID=MMETSP0799-20121207/39464_1 /TAXON_ID=46947 /ORGANISM="Geminigera cryophila, Strain CCMP2564" /LENGTH=191 /DNA_ID=CAMNT_0021254641 /DNA_START=161 /DNA_END=736 /DNA_ORIENTATION=-
MKRPSGLASLALLLLFPLHAAGFLHVPVSYTRLPVQRWDISLRAKKGVVPENYVDHYVVLGLPKQATTVEIKKAYRKLSQTYHPDVNSEAGAQDRFIQISSAYSVLGDEDERRKFDFSNKGGIAPDFAERVSGFREAAGPDYNKMAEKAERLIENKWAVIIFSSFLPVVLLLTMSFPGAKDWLREITLGPH